jgi:hypothetical protein
MKLRNLWIMVTLAVALVVGAACNGNGGVSEEEFQELQAKVTELKSRVDTHNQVSQDWAWVVTVNQRCLLKREYGLDEWIVLDRNDDPVDCSTLPTDPPTPPPPNSEWTG